MNPLHCIADELRPILNRVRHTKEILGEGGLDCAYLANKELETVLFRLSDLVQELSKEKMSMRTNTFIAGNYHIVSYGNGWAYEITDQTTGYTMWVQDHAAEELQAATQNFESLDCLSDYMEALGEPSDA